MTNECPCPECSARRHHVEVIKQMKSEWPEPEYDWEALEAADKASRSRITKAAILIAGQVYSVDPPGRHHDVIRIYTEGVGGQRRKYPQESPQGFLTIHGTFVDRAEAAKIAYLAGQIAQPKDSLYSEDLW